MKKEVRIFIKSVSFWKRYQIMVPGLSPYVNRKTARPNAVLQIDFEILSVLYLPHEMETFPSHPETWAALERRPEWQESKSIYK
jgi:hypothetical protein